VPITVDGPYDAKECYQEVAKTKANRIFPPRSNAGYWEVEHHRNEAVKSLKAGALTEWKEESGYHKSRYPKRRCIDTNSSLVANYRFVIVTVRWLRRYQECGR